MKLAPRNINFPFLGDVWRLAVRSPRYMDKLWASCSQENRDQYKYTEIAGLTIDEYRIVYLRQGMSRADTINTVCHELYHVASTAIYESRLEELRAICLGDACAYLLEALHLVTPDEADAA